VKMEKRQITAIGGGGFTVEPKNPAMELYVLRKREDEIRECAFCPRQPVILLPTSLNSMRHSR
jgi:hypothetical protein